MAETAELSTEDWWLAQMLDDGPPLIRTGPTAETQPVEPPQLAAPEPAAPAAPADPTPEPGPTTVPDPGPTGALGCDADPVATPGPAAADVNAGAKRALLVMGGAVALLVVAIVVAFTAFGGGPEPVRPPQHKPAAAPAVQAVTTTPPLPAPPRDEAISYDPSTESCPGPGSPLALTDTTTDSAWVCSRGPQEALLDGQILHINFTCPRSRPDTRCTHIVTSLSVTPGWVAKTPGGQEQWSQHRVVTKLQFNFFNGDELAADPFFLDTHSVHGPVPAVLPGKILASRVDVMILHTDRPPNTPAPTGQRGVGSPAGLADSMLGADNPPVPPADAGWGGTNATAPVDATFAMSQLQFFGHEPI